MIMIRKAYPTDAYSIVHLMLDVWKSEYNDILPANIVNNMGQDIDNKVRHLRDQIEENNRIFVAIDEDKIIGYIFYAKSTNESYSGSAEIRSLYILNDYQGKGIGSELLDKAKEEIKKLGFNGFILKCPSRNKNNDFFLKKGGVLKEMISSEISGSLIDLNVLYFDLSINDNSNLLEWQDLYTKLVNVSLNITGIKGTLALVESDGEVYLGLNAFKMVTALEVAVANMKMASKDKIDKILILNSDNELVIPNGYDLEVLMESGNENAQVLIDVTTIKVKRVNELISSYKKEERV